MQSRFIVLGLGSNLNALENLRKALLKLRHQQDFDILKVSRIYESKAQLPPGAPTAWDINYLNAAVLLEVKNFKPRSFLSQIKEFEKDLGRVQAEKWAPRIIDLDILYVHDFEFSDENLKIPHPMLYKRPFAWQPALEIWPSLPQRGISGFETQVSQNLVWPKLVAILNMTPDSFSDGGKFFNEDAFLKQARRLIEEGADYLDIGAESTRPGAETITAGEEKHRLTVAFEAIKKLKNEGYKCKISLDSRNYESVSYIAENYTLDMINDVSGLKDLRILNLACQKNIKVVCMHSLTVPADKNVTLKNVDPTQDISQWWKQKTQELTSYDNIIFDPGFGFGKTAEQSRYLFNQLKNFKNIQQEFFLGYSRKSFLNAGLDKDLETALATSQLNLAYAQYIRVHDVASQKLALRMMHGL